MSTQQQRSRSPVAVAVYPESPHVSPAVLLSTIVVPPIAFLLLVRTSLVLPSMSVVALAGAESSRLRRGAPRPTATARAFPCGISPAHTRSLDLPPACSVILNK